MMKAMLRLFLFAAVLAPALLIAQARDPYRFGDPGVTWPRPVHRVGPEIPKLHGEYVRGSVMFEFVVDEKGLPTDIVLITPAGPELDEAVLSALRKWKFEPGTKDGQPVKVLTLFFVTFDVPPPPPFNRNADEPEASYREAALTLGRANLAGEERDRAVKSIRGLARKKFPPAMCLLGTWETEGQYVPKDSPDGLGLIQKAADKKYGPALYQIALRRIEGRDLPADVPKGLEEMSRAALLGSPEAQFYLGSRHVTGDGVPRDLERARQDFRLCAVRGIAECQYRLGKLLFDAPDRRERDYVQAIALFQLAGEQGHREAEEIASRETPKLTPAQTTGVKNLKAHLAR